MEITTTQMEQIVSNIMNKIDAGLLWDTICINNFQRDINSARRNYDKEVQRRQSLKSPSAIKKCDKEIELTKRRIEKLIHDSKTLPDKVARINKIVDAVKTNDNADDIQIKFAEDEEDMLYCYLILDPNCKYSDTPLYCGWDTSFTPPFDENDNWIEGGCRLFPVFFE